MISRSAALVLAPALLAATAFPALAADSSTLDAGASKIRVVRLSESKGAVLMDRAIGRGFEHAMANMPIVEGSSLRTDQGVAEVEFEDNSSLRLAPNSTVEFPKLERLATGATVSTVRLVRGTAYVSLVKSKTGNPFSLAFDQENVALEPGSHVRLDMDEKQVRLAMLDGSAHVEGPAGTEEIARKKTLNFSLADQTHSVDKDIASEPFDDWDKTATGYHARTASYSALSSSTPYAYGLNDMSYYGSFADLGGGCGSMWRPYFASAAWDPYSNGAWAFYQGAGYSWVSPYPWGWTPYHTGTWSYCSGAGWGWLPGGGWNGLGNGTSLIAGATGGNGIQRFQPKPVRPPLPGEPTITAVGLKPLVRSGLASPESFVFRNDSAGLGIPREELGKLDKVSRQTMERGSASTHIYLSAPTISNANVRSGASQSLGAVSMHRGSAPSGGYAETGARGEFAGSGRMGSAPSSVTSSGMSRSAGPSPSSGGGHSK
jgi:hypothetical protein